MSAGLRDKNQHILLDIILVSCHRRRLSPHQLHHTKNWLVFPSGVLRRVRKYGKCEKGEAGFETARPAPPRGAHVCIFLFSSVEMPGRVVASAISHAVFRLSRGVQNYVILTSRFKWHVASQTKQSPETYVLVKTRTKQ